ncbi:MAG TPA: U32 family peptidase, partial [Escherichia coli]|nr:U32 family peptidase [Escherichia coli]
LRVRNNDFSTLQALQEGIAGAHARGKQFFVASNIFAHNAKLKTYLRDMEPVIAMRPDALIMADPGLIMMVRDKWPDVPVHLSVQANAVNWADVHFWHRMGLTRVILSRELSLDEIEEIRQRCPEMVLEVFVHGPLCIAYSGRCLLSGYINKRDPNQGTCTNSCRWDYKVKNASEDASGDLGGMQVVPLEFHQALAEADNNAFSALHQQPRHPLADQPYLIEEAQRPGQLMPTFEDEHGTYIMNSKDLRAIAHVERLTKMGVHSLKIEGRTKSFYYCARTAQVYRKAIDDAAAGKPFDTSLLETLEGLAHRGYTEGFLRRHTHDDYQNYEYGYSVSDRQQFVGEFTGERKGDLAAVAVKNKFSVGDSLELMTPQGNINFTLEHMENAKGEAMPVAPGDGYTVWLPVPQDLELNYALLMRNFSGETTRNPHGK